MTILTKTKLQNDERSCLRNTAKMTSSNKKDKRQRKDAKNCQERGGKIDSCTG